MNKVLKLILCILFTEAVGGVSGFITANSIGSWYTTINKPSFNPPNFVFGPVWSVLYLLMGISLFMVLNHKQSREKQQAVSIFGIQLLLNFLWSIIFFTWHSPVVAMVDISALWLFIIFMILNFAKLDKTAGYLQVPYLLWVTFAAVLNGAICMLN